MQDARLFGKYYGPALVFVYIVLTAMVVFALHITLAAKLVVVIVSALVFIAALKPGAQDTPPFGTVTDDEAVVRPRGARGH